MSVHEFWKSRFLRTNGFKTNVSSMYTILPQSLYTVPLKIEFTEKSRNDFLSLDHTNRGNRRTKRSFPRGSSKDRTGLERGKGICYDDRHDEVRVVILGRGSGSESSLTPLGDDGSEHLNPPRTLTPRELLSLLQCPGYK